MESEFLWQRHMLDDLNIEAKQNMPQPIELLNMKCRVFVWNMCIHMNVGDGVPGLACRLVEHYLCIKWHEKKPHLTTSQLMEFEEIMEKLFPLITASCIYVAAKANNLWPQENNGSIICDILQRVGLICNNEQVRSVVSSIIGVVDGAPSWTSVNVGLFLAREMDIPLRYFDRIEFIIDFAELVKVEIQMEAFRKDDMPYQTLRTNSVRTLHLTAAAIVAALRTLDVCTSDAKKVSDRNTPDAFNIHELLKRFDIPTI